MLTTLNDSLKVAHLMKIEQLTQILEGLLEGGIHIIKKIQTN